jgi:hypothetical protein
MCIFSASGRHFDAKAFAARTNLPVSSVWLRGEPLILKGPNGGPRRRSNSAVSASVSKASWNDLSKQVRDAERFLRRHAVSLASLRRNRKVERMVLDFPILLRIGQGRGGKKIAVQSDHFPATRVEAAGRAGVALELTIYG